jgi:cold shock CspA family protein
MRQQGSVLEYRVASGFGFIKTAQGQSLFFHIKNVRDGFLLESGDAVIFTIGSSTKHAGKSECFDVELMERASKAVRQ